LEHTRIFHFYNGGEAEVLCASADWMGRNLLRRVETCFPITDKKLAREVINLGLRPYLRDNSGAWNLRQDGKYHRIHSKSKPYNAQNTLMKHYGKLAKVVLAPKNKDA